MKRRGEADEVQPDDEEEPQQQAGWQRTGKSKKAKQENFPLGTIKKIRVNDFMTYAGTVEIEPGPRLNLVLGPNGTGKSSLVCAICIGLGGSTKTLGRADNLAEYIRRGRSSCWTEITLAGKPLPSGAPRDYVLRRDIKVETNQDGVKTFKTSWRVNGADSTQKDVKEIVAKLNIQFDNLCQFLPQDKVAEFAMMNPQQLLEATEKAIGDAELHRQHMELVHSKAQYNQDKLTRDTHFKHLEKLKAEHASQQREYERFEAREGLRKCIEQLQAKILWLRYDQAKQKYMEAREKLKEADEKLAQRKAQLQEDTGPLRRLEARVEKLKGERNACGKSLVNMQRTLAENARHVDQAKGEMDDAIGRKAQLQQQSDARRARLAELGASIQQLRADVAAAPVDAPAHMHAQHGELVAQSNAVLNGVTDAEEVLAERRQQAVGLERSIHANAQALAALADVRQQRLRNLEQRKRGVSFVHEWIHEQLSRGDVFRGPVLGPVGLEINCRPEYASYLEQHIAPRLDHFVVSCREDSEILSEFIKSQRLSFTVAALPEEDTMPHPLGTAAQYAQVGVAHTLDEVFEAPNLIKHYLKDGTGINRAFILHDNADPEQVAAALPPVPPGKSSSVTMYKRGVMYQHTQSAYNSAATSLNIKNCRPANLLAGSVAAGVDEERRRLSGEREQLLTKREALAAGVRTIEQQIQQSVEQARALQEQAKALEMEMQRIRGKRGQLAKMLKAKEGTLALERAKPDPMERQEEYMQVIRKHANQLQKLGVAAHKCVNDMWAALKQLAALELSVKEAEMQAGALADAAERRKASLRQLEEQVKQLQAQVNAAKAAAADAKVACTSIAPMTDELKRLLQQPPLSVEEVEEDIRAKEVEMDNIVCTNPHVFREYAARQKAISEMTQEVAAADAELEAVQVKMRDVRDSWLPELTRIVQQVNESFSANFAEIGCAGEVVLEEQSLQQEEWDKCALEIRVKFRESEQLTLLTNTRQSGGERSVSTVLFLIALQGVTVTPFRVIDEINQGMDPINERKVFTLLVSSACRPDTPQCFLLTPKLLPGLAFTRDITVLEIMNGPHVNPQLPGMLGDKMFALLGVRGARGRGAGPAAAAAACEVGAG